jgi:hypothetical protein
MWAPGAGREALGAVSVWGEKGSSSGLGGSEAGEGGQSQIAR